MSENAQIKFFLGANTADGFKSKFDELRNMRDYRYQYIIKGSPGSGKSTFMRMIADKAEGQKIEYICCSSDDKSLDGIILCDEGISFADGTAPHVVEPQYAGARESYIDFTQFLNVSELSGNTDKIAQQNKQVKEHYKAAYSYLKCAHTLINMSRELIKYAQYDRIGKRIDGIIKNEFPHKKYKPQKGMVYKRYLSGITPNGYLTFYDTINTMCTKIIGFEDDFGLSDYVMRMLSDGAQSANLDVYECLCPIDSTDRIEHLIIPEIKLAFTSGGIYGISKFNVTKNVNLNHYIPPEILKEHASETKYLHKLSIETIDRAVSAIKDAKTCHDALEKIYNPYVDFDAIRTAANELR